MREPVTGPMPVGGLHLPKDVGLSESTAARIQDWDTSKKVDNGLATVGMLPNTAPTIAWAPVSVEGLTTTDPMEYARLFAAQLRWLNYANRLLADIRANILQVKIQKDRIEAARRNQLRELNKTAPKAEKMSKDEIDDRVLDDPSYQSVYLQWQELEQYRIKLDAWVEELDASLRTVSRQVENRRDESRAGNREGNMPSSISGWKPRGQAGP